MHAARRPLPAGDGHPGTWVEGDTAAHRTSAGDVILAAPGANRTGRQRADQRRVRPSAGRATGLRMAAVLLSVVAVAAAVLTVVTVASRAGSGPPAPHAASPGATSAATTGTEFGTKPIRPYPGLPGRTGPSTSGIKPPGSPTPTPSTKPPGSPTPTPSTGASAPAPPIDAGGLTKARARVSEFVAALNENDPARANEFLCARMAGTFDDGMLDGIVPGSLGVGGVSVQGTTGTAFVTYQPTGGGDRDRAVFGLVVELDQWMICSPMN